MISNWCISWHVLMFNVCIHTLSPRSTAVVLLMLHIKQHGHYLSNWSLKIRNADCGYPSASAVCGKMLDLHDVQYPSHNLNTFAVCVQVTFNCMLWMTVNWSCEPLRNYSFWLDAWRRGKCIVSAAVHAWTQLMWLQGTIYGQLDCVRRRAVSLWVYTFR
jgi:hypothetical protein